MNFLFRRQPREGFRFIDSVVGDEQVFPWIPASVLGGSLAPERGGSGFGLNVSVLHLFSHFGLPQLAVALGLDDEIGDVLFLVRVVNPQIAFRGLY